MTIQSQEMSDDASNKATVATTIVETETITAKSSENDGNATHTSRPPLSPNVSSNTSTGNTTKRCPPKYLRDVVTQPQEVVQPMMKIPALLPPIGSSSPMDNPSAPNNNNGTHQKRMSFPRMSPKMSPQMSPRISTKPKMPKTPPNNNNKGTPSSPSAYDVGAIVLDRSLSFLPLLKRNTTFWPTTEEILAKHPSLESLNPKYDSKLRTSSPISAIFNLVATVCGGGVLTLPIAFARAGIITSTILMIFSALITNFAMYILCSCARRTGGVSYGDVTRKAFGQGAQVLVTVLLFIFLCFVIVAYMVLVKEIWTPVLFYLFPKTLTRWCVELFDLESDDVMENGSGQIGVLKSEKPSDAFLVIFILVSLPLLLKKDLYALRHTCYVGFTSLIILVVAVANQAYNLNCIDDVGIFQRKVKWWHDDINDIIFAFPIIALSFFSIYNVLSVHSALMYPTWERVKFVLDGTIVLCFVLFYIVAMSGALYAYDETKDNILLNFPLDEPIVFVGRIGYGFTLMFGLPLVFLPCREALLTIPQLLSKWRNEGRNYTGSDDEEKKLISSDISIPTVHQQGKNYGTSSHSSTKRQTGVSDNGHLIINGVDFDEERPKFGGKIQKSISDGRHNREMKMETDPKYGSGEETTSLLRKNSSRSDTSSKSNNTNTFLTRKASSNISADDTSKPSRAQSSSSFDEDAKPTTSTAVHVLSTLTLLISGYIAAIAVPGVGTVWSICGSSMSLIIGFGIPAACYLKLRSKKRSLHFRAVGAWLLLVFSIVSSVVCTYFVVLNLPHTDNLE